MRPIRVLYVNGGIMDRGGISAFMMNYYRHIDRTKIQIDFVVHGFKKGVFDDEIKQLGGEIYNVPIKSKDFLGNIKGLRKIFLSGKYKIVHSHMDAMGAVILKEAKKCKIPIRIAHSHSTEHLTVTKVQFLLNEFARKHITRYATHFFACSEPAGRWLFGDEYAEAGMVKYIKNAIELDQYIFDEALRKQVKKELKVENNLVIGHVGRLEHQKNHFYLLEVFKDLLTIKPEAKLILVGDGLLKSKIVQKIETLNLADAVIVLGARDDVNVILNAVDVFVLPSHFEGLGIALVEAQANGVYCIASESVPGEVNITGKVQFLPIDDSGKKMWVEAMTTQENKDDRNVDLNTFISTGYSIKNEVKVLQELYLNYLEEIQ